MRRIIAIALILCALANNAYASIFEEVASMHTGETLDITDLAAIADPPQTAEMPVSIDVDEGIFVPSYNAFMQKFYSYVRVIDPNMADLVEEKCAGAEAWNDNDRDVLLLSSQKPYIYLNEGAGYLESVMIELRKGYSKEAERLFKLYVFAAGRAILPHATEEYWDGFFDLIQYDYTVSSPAGYISMYTNCGVYLVTLTKSSQWLSLDFTLSVYQPE